MGTKSAAALRLFVARDGEVRPHAAGMELRPEDQVRVLPAPAGYDRLLLVWVDGEGGMQVVHPWEGEASGELPRPGEALDGSLILDEKAGMEHLVAFFSDAPVAAPEALAWLSRRAGAFDCGLFELDGVPVEVVVVRLVKEAR